MRGRKGFSLVEAMVVLVLMVLIMSSVYLMIMYFRDVSGTEQARVRQTQESRYLLSVFSSELKNAGAVMTLANTNSFLAASPYFNGIYPLNNTNFPDGVILASGDPNAVSKLIAEAKPSISPVLLVNNTIADPAWAPGDQGILIGTAGFYVFSVETSTSSSITMAETPVYYSGLLHTTNYIDPGSPAGTGNIVTYPVNAPVMRLADFSIYLIDERDDAAKGRKVRELVRVTDCAGRAAVLTDPSPDIIKGVITENVWDLQLSYTSYPNFPGVEDKTDFFTSSGSSDPDARLALLTALSDKTFKELTVYVVALTDDYPGKGAIAYSLPPLADRAATTLPSGKFNYKTYSFLIEPRNYNIKF